MEVLKQMFHFFVVFCECFSYVLNNAYRVSPLYVSFLLSVKRQNVLAQNIATYFSDKNPNCGMCEQVHMTCIHTVLTHIMLKGDVPFLFLEIRHFGSIPNFWTRTFTSSTNGSLTTYTRTSKCTLVFAQHTHTHTLTSMIIGREIFSFFL